MMEYKLLWEVKLPFCDQSSFVFRLFIIPFQLPGSCRIQSNGPFTYMDISLRYNK
jgi:hypothetical protein